MLLDKVFDRFVAATPICVAVRGLMESALDADCLDRLFARTAKQQYQKELLFSTCVDLMAGVVCRTHKSVNSAHRDLGVTAAVSVQSLYEKLARIEPETSAELVRHTSGRLQSVIGHLKGALPPFVSGYRTKVLDGNHLTRTQRRLKPLRDVAAGPLPGQTLVVFDPALGLVVDLVACEDGHAQERSLMASILAGAEADDLWVADRNFCTTGILFGLAKRGAKFAIRQHASTLYWEKEGVRRSAGRCESGKLFEQWICLEDKEGGRLKVRRITLVLDKPTREGETEIHVMTNLPKSVRASKVMKVYRKRWRIEALFQDMTMILKCEINTLGYPRAALFGFCVAVVAANVLATAKAALRVAHPAANVEEEVSNYYLADELSGNYRGMMIALPPEVWKPIADLDDAQLAAWLREVLGNAKLSRYRKSPRGPKKPFIKRTRFARKKKTRVDRQIAGGRS